MTKARNLLLKERAVLLRKNHPDATRKEFAALMTLSTISPSHPKGMVGALREACKGKDGFKGKFKKTGRPLVFTSISIENDND